MKKSLLFLASLCMSASGFAQTWTKPVPAATEMVMGDTLYLYNTEAKAFLTGANDWETRASVSATGGHKIVIKEGKDENTLTIANLVLKGNKAGKMSSLDCGGFDNMWVDGDGRDGDGLWHINKEADGAYTISNDNVTTGNLGVAESFKGKTGDTRCYIFDAEQTYETEDSNGDAVTLPSFSGAFWDKWAFVSPAEYEKVISGLLAYDAAEKLKKALDEAKAQYPSVDFSSIEAVYNNTSSTAEELNEAQKNIKKAINNFLTGKLAAATALNPVDATEFITNPSFETGDLTGWTADKKNPNGKGDSSDLGAKENGNATYHCDNADGDYLFNIWSWGNPITQTVQDLPEGIYSLEAMVASSDDCTNVYITADGGYGEMHHAIELQMPKQTGGTRGSFTFPSKGDITIGAVGCDTDGKSYIKGGVWWYKVDDFKLNYYGNGVDAYQKWANEYVENMPVYDEDTQATLSLKEAYNKAAEDLKNGTSKEDIIAAYETIASLSDSIAANMKAYSGLMTKIQEWNEIAENSDYGSDLFDDFVSFVNSSEDDIEGWPTPTAYAISMGNYALETKDIDTYIDTVSKLLQEAIASSLKEGDDCTSMIVNAAWTDKNGAGWKEVSGKCTNKSYSAGLTAFPVAESYHSIFDFQQELKNVQDGLYSVSLNGFCRLDGGETEVPAEIYMNDFATKLVNLKDGGLTDEPEDGVNCYIVADSWKNNPLFAESTASGSGNVDKQDDNGNYIPDGMVGSSIAFSADRYKAKAYGLVQGGTMKIGVRNLTSTTVWALWSNFKLTYEGKNVDALMEVIASTTENMEKYLENNVDNMPENKHAEINALIEKLTDAAKTKNAEAMWDALIANNTEFGAVKEYVPVYADYVAAFEKMSTTLEDYAASATDEALADATKYSETDASSLNKEDLQTLIDNIILTTVKLRLPKHYNTATDDEPVEMTAMIFAPSFEENGSASSDGWKWNAKATGDTGVKDNSNSTYNISNADGSFVFNTWNKEAVDGGYWVAQSVKELPAGMYELTALVASDAGNTISLTAGNDTNSTTLTTPKEQGIDISVIFAVKEGQDETEIKVSSNTWFKADNFRLNYFGSDSQKQPTEIEGTEASNDSAPVSITTLSGVTVKSLVKGIDIITKANGEKVKIYVK